MGSARLPRVRLGGLRASPGTLSAQIFENATVRLRRTLFYDLEIPLAPFDSGLPGDSKSQPKRFQLSFLQLGVRDWRELAGRTFALPRDQADGSIYLGGVHNPVDVLRLRFGPRKHRSFRIRCRLHCDFEFENVARSCEVPLEADVDFRGIRIAEWMLKGARDPAASALRLIAELAAADAYASEPANEGRPTFFAPLW